MSKSDQVQLWRCHILVKFPCWENWPICFIYFFETRAFNAQCFSEASSFKRSRAIMQIKGRPETQHVKQHTNFVWEYKWWYWKQFKWSSLKQYIWIFHNHPINRILQAQFFSSSSATLRVPPALNLGKEKNYQRSARFVMPFQIFYGGSEGGWLLFICLAVVTVMGGGQVYKFTT